MIKGTLSPLIVLWESKWKGKGEGTGGFRRPCQAPNKFWQETRSPWHSLATRENTKYAKAVIVHALKRKLVTILRWKTQ